jgi:hypothetical protein
MHKLLPAAIALLSTTSLVFAQDVPTPATSWLLTGHPLPTPATVFTDLEAAAATEFSLSAPRKRAERASSRER